MLQQSAIENRRHRIAFIEALSSDSGPRRELKKDLQYLGEDYASLISIAANMASHYKWIPYPFITNRLRKIADDLRSNAELVRVKIVELGGVPPQVSLQTREDVDFRGNVRRLVSDMEEHASRSEAFVHQKNNMTDRDVIRLVDFLASEMQRRNEELLDIVMRLS